ncbi:MAG: signal peptidase I [Verrucomicrobiota bacterium]|nr:signal peptidase I [Verrucomicrobiota bacterium]
MLSFFAPRAVRHGRLVHKHARKFLSYKSDVMSAADREDFEHDLASLGAAIHAHDGKQIEAMSESLDRKVITRFPPPADAAWRENCEVFLVAIIIALAVRTYFLQPFTIPTGSMQPTLNGIIGHPTKEPPPNVFARIANFAIFGRTYVNVVSEVDDNIVDLVEAKRFLFFTYTEIQCANRSYMVHASRSTLASNLLGAPRAYRAGEVIVRGYINTGDHVFVDKITYNFRAPYRGEVFVFSTSKIRTRENQMTPDAPSQYYIKRLGGLPGDELRIDPPNLYANGQLATEPGFARVIASSDGYRGYSNGPEGGRHFDYLGEPDQPFRVPAHSYFALGDNSYHSSDSRDWGIVPEQNLMGRGVFVYWPFAPHWGLIR